MTSLMLSVLLLVIGTALLHGSAADLCGIPYPAALPAAVRSPAAVYSLHSSTAVAVVAGGLASGNASAAVYVISGGAVTDVGPNNMLSEARYEAASASVHSSRRASSYGIVAFGSKLAAAGSPSTESGAVDIFQIADGATTATRVFFQTTSLAQPRSLSAASGGVNLGEKCSSCRLSSDQSLIQLDKPSLWSLAGVPSRMFRLRTLKSTSSTWKVPRLLQSGPIHKKS